MSARSRRCSCAEQLTIDSFLTAEVPLTRGLVAIIDAADWERVSRYRWHAMPQDKRLFRAAANVANVVGRRKVLLHRFILSAPRDLEVDHVNGDPLDNRRCNLRLATAQENARNQGKTHGRSRYKGVSFRMDLRSRPWVAKLKVSGRTVHLGYFATEEEAARAYDAAAKRFFGEFARLNNFSEPMTTCAGLAGVRDRTPDDESPSEGGEAA